MTTKRNIFAVLACLTLAWVTSADDFDTDWETLEQHPVPAWFQDAKFGIYAHLGVYCVPAHASEWYPRYMYTDGHPVQDYHAKTYGPQAEFGYKDFIPMFTLENFDADEWAALYQRAGARFAGPVAEHHDGFSMWASTVNRWNAKDMGPKRDVVGEMAAALRRQNLKLLTSFHHGFNIGGYFPVMEGTDTADPADADLYGKFADSTEGYDRWLAKLVEVIDAYQPDQIWFDWGLRELPLEYRRKLASYYYAQEAKWGKPVIITRKLDQLPDGVGVLDHERGGSRDKTPFLWQTDDSVSSDSWSWREGFKIRSTRSMLHELIDIVSKNGVLLMNVCPKADGTISDDQKKLLREMGDWLEVNGEAIYQTRPWRIHGEGPRLFGNRGPSLIPTSATLGNPVNIRFTTRGDTLYAIGLDWRGEAFTFDSVLIRGQSAASSVSLLGYGPIPWTVSEYGHLQIGALPPEARSNAPARALKLEGFEIVPEPFALPERLVLLPANATPTGEIIVRPANPKAATPEEDRLYHWANPRDSIHWLVNVKESGDYLVRLKSCSRFHPARLVLDNGEHSIQLQTSDNPKWGTPAVRDGGILTFAQTGLYRINLGSEDRLEWPGAEIWNLELTPAR